MNRFSLEQLINESEYAYALIEDGGKIIWRNQSFNNLFEIKIYDKVNIQDLDPEKGTCKELIEKLKDKKLTHFKVEKKYRKKNGETFIAEVFCTIARDKNEKEIAHFVEFQDATNKVQKRESVLNATNELHQFIMSLKTVV